METQKSQQAVAKEVSGMTDASHQMRKNVQSINEFVQRISEATQQISAQCKEASDTASSIMDE